MEKDRFSKVSRIDDPCIFKDNETDVHVTFRKNRYFQTRKFYFYPKRENADIDVSVKTDFTYWLAENYPELIFREGAKPLRAKDALAINKAVKEILPTVRNALDRLACGLEYRRIPSWDLVDTVFDIYTNCIAAIDETLEAMDSSEFVWRENR